MPTRDLLTAAREAFLADPNASLEQVAMRAGLPAEEVRKSHPDRAALVELVCRDGLGRHQAAVREALADPGDPWAAFAAFVHRCVTEGIHAFNGLAGTFTPSAGLLRMGRETEALTHELFELAWRAGVLREDLEVDDLFFLLQQIAAVDGGSPRRSLELQRRYTAIVLDGLRFPGATPLTGPPPSWEDVVSPWVPEQRPR